MDKGIAYQIRALREDRNLSQEKLAAMVEMNQNAISRLESPKRGRPTITTLKRIAEALDVALVVRFVPFSKVANWISGTPYVEIGISTGELAPPNFDKDDGFTQQATTAIQRHFVTVGQANVLLGPGTEISGYTETLWGPGIQNVYPLNTSASIANLVKTQNRYAQEFYQLAAPAKPTEKIIPALAVQSSPVIEAFGA